MTARASILTIGDELVLGDRIDTNGPWLSCELSRLGVTVTQHRSVHDDVQAIATAVKELAQTNEILVVTGGLGPTEDDRTREALAQAMCEKLVFDSDAHASIAAWFAQRGATMPSQNESQAFRPSSTTWVLNTNGTAPGLMGSLDNCRVLALPGPPSELQLMFAQAKKELLLGVNCGDHVKTLEIHLWGLAESLAGEKIADLMQLEEPCVAILMGNAGITARVTHTDSTVMHEVALEIERRWEPWVYGRDETTVATCIGNKLTTTNGSLVTAESCTGGLVSDLLVQTSGASTWFRGGWIAYSNEQKQTQLNIPSELLEEHGAVSRQVAQAMCEGAIQCSGTTVAVSTTGIAGPEGGSEEKPVGTVYIGCIVDGDAQIRLFRFSGDRQQIRMRAAHTAMQMVRFRLLGIEAPTMCWQHSETFQC